MDKDKLCPHCGYYCTGKSIFCLVPIIEETAYPVPEKIVKQVVRTDNAS